MTIHPKGLANKPESHTDDYLPISAIEACEKTKTYVEAKNEEQLKSIFDQIAAQITKGYYSLNVYEPISPQNITILKEYGYQINITSHANSFYCGSPATLTTINWKDAQEVKLKWEKTLYGYISV